MLTKMCEVERREIQNSLSLASTSPDELAYNIMQKPGYLAKLTGEAVHNKVYANECKNTSHQRML